MKHAFFPKTKLIESSTTKILLFNLLVINLLSFYFFCLFLNIHLNKIINLGAPSGDFAEVVYDVLKSSGSCNLESELTVGQINAYLDDLSQADDHAKK